MNKNVPDFPYVVAPNHVALCYEDKIHRVKDGIEEPYKKTKIRVAIIVSAGKLDENQDLFVPGRKVLMPSVNKQQFEIDGMEFYVCHYLDIKVIDPIDSDELMLDFLKMHHDSLPERIKMKFFTDKYKGL